MILKYIVAFAAVLAPAARAHGYPSKLIRVIVTFPSGGTPDT